MYGCIRYYVQIYLRNQGAKSVNLYMSGSSHCMVKNKKNALQNTLQITRYPLDLHLYMLLVRAVGQVELSCPEDIRLVELSCLEDISRFHSLE